MNVIEKKANEIAARMTNTGMPETSAFDPATILLIISIIVELVKLVKTCKATPKATLERLQKPNAITIASTRAIIRQQTRIHKKQEMKGAIEVALISVSKASTEEEMAAAYEAASV